MDTIVIFANKNLETLLRVVLIDGRTLTILGEEDMAKKLKWIFALIVLTSTF
jgi:hypothetical protein